MACRLKSLLIPARTANHLTVDLVLTNPPKVVWNLERYNIWKNRFPFLSKFIFNNVSKEGENLRRIQKKRKKERLREGENNKFHPQYLKSEAYGSNMLRFYTYFSITLRSSNTREKRWSWNMYRYTYGLLPALCIQSCNIHIYISICRYRPM